MCPGSFGHREALGELLAFYDFPASHWLSLRTTNPIESAFATIRLRSRQTRGCVSRSTALAMTYKLAMAAQKHWRRMRGFRQLANVYEFKPFKDGVPADGQQNNISCAA